MTGTVKNRPGVAPIDGTPARAAVRVPNAEVMGGKS